MKTPPAENNLKDFSGIIKRLGKVVNGSQNQSDLLFRVSNFLEEACPGIVFNFWAKDPEERTLYQFFPEKRILRSNEASLFAPLLEKEGEPFIFNITENPLAELTDSFNKEDYQTFIAIPVRLQQNKCSIAGFFLPSFLTENQKESFTNIAELTVNQVTNAFFRFRAESTKDFYQDKYFQISEYATEALHINDQQAFFNYASPAVEKITGYTPEELQGIDVYSLFHEKDIPYIKKVRQEVYEKGISRTFNYRLLTKSGEYSWLETHMHPQKDNYTGEVIATINVTKNIDARKKALEALQRSEERYRQLVESSQDFIYKTDPRGNFLYVNNTGIRTMGYSTDEIYRMTYLDLIRPDYREYVRNFYKAQYHQRIPNVYLEFPVVTKNGEELWVGQHVQMFLEDDWISCYQATARDITERKKVEDELIKAKQMAEKSMQAKEQFLSIMSHEIRTPLNSIVGLTHLLLQENLSRELLDYLHAIKLSSDNLLSLINDVLDFSKLESGKITFESISFNLKSLIKDISKIFIHQAREKDIDLKVTIGDHVPSGIIGDPVRLNQILSNLLSNAIKFTEKGEVRIEVSLVETYTNEVTLSFAVKDTGIGIPEEKKHSIFEVFTQARTDTSRRFGGTGLGLTITKKLVELQGGSIQVDSKQGKGSTFSFELTFEKSFSPIQDTENFTQTEFQPFKDLRILVAEDNKLNQMVAYKYLEKWNASVDIVENGLEAINRVQEQEFDLILMDLQMPYYDGYQASQYIKQELGLNIPILALTATTSLNLTPYGIEDLILKPFDPSNLYNKIISFVPDQKFLSMTEENKTNQHYESPADGITDLSYLLEAADGNYSFVKEMIETFLQQSPEYMDHLHKTFWNKDWKNMAEAAHKLKTPSSMIGLKDTEKTLKLLEDYALNKGSLDDDPATIIKDIDQTIQEAQKELTERLREFE